MRATLNIDYNSLKILHLKCQSKNFEINYFYKLYMFA